ncbi:MAG: two-component system, OmpR family, sensor kinase [Rubrobacteraceae bacterium]|nr:two-component system, OmpR family, sensor kinase [Rubrobacteraceae bacterium]
MPIRWRLTIFIALVIGAILLVLGVALFLLNRSATLSGIEDAAQSRATTAAQTINSGEDLSNDDIEQLTRDGVFVIVRDGSGNVLANTVNLPAEAEASDTAWRRALDSKGGASGTMDLSKEPSVYVYAVPVDPSNGPARVVEAGKSYESAQESVQVFGTVLVAGIGAAFLLSIGGAYFLARAALKPVDAVVSAAREMGEGDLAKRLPVANPKDEIGRLASTINGLLSRLEAAFIRREEALSRQRRFAADASHELRTPLTAILGHAWVLVEWAIEKDPKTAKQSVLAIRREARRMRGLVEDLLALTRGDEGAPLDVGRHDLAKVAEEAVQAVRAAVNGKVSIEYAGSGREVEATFDKGRVLQVAAILLDNAVKYTPEGGRVTVRTWENKDQVALEVSDTGIGIPQDQLPLIFERFHRVDNSRTEEGAGLGLAIARQIAESHDGEIEARSTPAEGSTFTLLLPKKALTTEP